MSSVIRLKPAGSPCHFKLVSQHGRGSNRRAVYVCQTKHATLDGCQLTHVVNGFSVKGKK